MHQQFSSLLLNTSLDSIEKLPGSQVIDKSLSAFILQKCRKTTFTINTKAFCINKKQIYHLPLAFYTVTFHSLFINQYSLAIKYIS